MEKCRLSLAMKIGKVAVDCKQKESAAPDEHSYMMEEGGHRP